MSEEHICDVSQGNIDLLIEAIEKARVQVRDSFDDGYYLGLRSALDIIYGDVEEAN
jgi:hypothetical protein